MMGQPDTPPRANGALCFAHPWERQAFGIAIALAREGCFEWEEFRQELMAEIEGWERTHELDDPAWDYYERWLAVLERLVGRRMSPSTIPFRDASDRDPSPPSPPTGARA